MCDPSPGAGADADCEQLDVGHYIVHYRWKGYSDCTDVNVHDTAVGTVDGGWNSVLYIN